MAAHDQPSRRHFLQSSIGFAATASTLASLHAAEPQAPASERIRVGCVGVQGRANFLTQAFAKRGDVEMVAVCDLDQSNLAKGLEAISKITGKTPAVAQDYRRLIDRNDIDVVVVGTPDHWHAIPTILACQSGKDVYVEKPDGHNIVEGQRMVAALKKHKRIVQLGTQSRSNPNFLKAMEYIREGHLGKCLVAKAWESAKQGSIGHPPDGEPPAGVDYDLWLGAAPKRPFNPKRFHGNWRWFFDYGTGDLGNDGVHRLDVARWALSTAGEALGEAPLGIPTKISALGGKWYFDDDQQFPDTMQVNYEFPGNPGKILTYEMRLWAPYHYFDETEGRSSSVIKVTSSLGTPAGGLMARATS
ncbi:MAG: Gfo/Idh/MocA family oxidoreductase [Planctomycetales bacterium]